MRPKDDPRKGLGIRAEEIAARHLKDSGYRILKRNFRTPLGEIDIIALKGDTLTFIEVRSRNEGGFDPLESINAAKQKKLVRTAGCYANSLKKEHPSQFDVIGITFAQDGTYTLDHIENAFFMV